MTTTPTQPPARHPMVDANGMITGEWLLWLTKGQLGSDRLPTDIPAANLAPGMAGVDISGNAETASRLETPRAINGVPFDGSADISLPPGGGGVVPLEDGGTGADLSATGGTGQFVRQSIAAAPLTVGPVVPADLPAGIDAAKISAGVVSNTEFDYLDGAASNIQRQINRIPRVPGADGADGADGFGSPGPRGNTGVSGATGARGRIGMGLQGEPGDDGFNGWPGPRGATGPAGAGDVNGPADSVASEAALFDGITGKLLKRATGTGVVHRTSGVDSVSAVVEADLTLADNTTADVSTTAHGLAPKAPADATKFLNGDNPPAWAVPAGGGGTSEVLKARVVYTDAQIKAGNTTPLEIIAAPGVDKYVNVIECFTIKNTTAGAYGGAYFRIRYAGLTADLIVAMSLSMQIAEKRWDTGVHPSAGVGGTTNPINTAVQASFSADLTGGNAANYLVVEVVYTIVTDGP